MYMQGSDGACRYTLRVQHDSCSFVSTMSIQLPDLIEKMGDAEFAKRLGVPLRTVQSWRRCERQPRPAQAHEIVRMADGLISLDGIYPPPGDKQGFEG